MSTMYFLKYYLTKKKIYDFTMFRGVRFVAKGKKEFSLYIPFTSVLFVYFMLQRPVLLLYLENKKNFFS